MWELEPNVNPFSQQQTTTTTGDKVIPLCLKYLAVHGPLLLMSSAVIISELQDLYLVTIMQVIDKNCKIRELYRCIFFHDFRNTDKAFRNTCAVTPISLCSSPMKIHPCIIEWAFMHHLDYFRSMTSNDPYMTFDPIFVWVICDAYPSILAWELRPSKVLARDPSTQSLRRADYSLDTPWTGRFKKFNRYDILKIVAEKDLRAWP